MIQLFAGASNGILENNGKNRNFFVFYCFFRKYKENQKMSQTKTKDIYKTDLLCYNHFFRKLNGFRNKTEKKYFK